MKKNFAYIACAFAATAMSYGCSGADPAGSATTSPVDYVNPYMGNISHLLVPTYPTVHRPNSMLRVYPERADYTTDLLNGLPVTLVGHRGGSAMHISPTTADTASLRPVMAYSYDNETVTPYSYSVYLDDEDIDVDFAPSHQSAVYNFKFGNGERPSIVFEGHNGSFQADGASVSGVREIGRGVNLYLYAESDTEPEGTKEVGNALALVYPEGTGEVAVRYGVSLISTEQAKKNLMREIPTFSVDEVAADGRREWNDALGKIKATGASADDLTVFYTSLYRCMERPVNISEDGQYFSGFDLQVHSDDGVPFYTDDWTWDTYRAAHPLRCLIDTARESHILNSYLRMAAQNGHDWFPTFPGVSGDGHAMNCNHGVASMIDAWRKGIRTFDLARAYEVSKKSVEEKTLIPWSNAPAGELDDFYKAHGYLPALRPGEAESVAAVSEWEKRQPIAVTLGTAYDEWCISQMAEELGDSAGADKYLRNAYNYRNLFHPDTHFFHPKDKNGNFIPGLDYRYAGGTGARDYYDENNAYVYRWDVQHNVADLIELIGGNEAFAAALDSMFREPLGMSKWGFYAFMPDHTGNVGQFSMANEPSLHVPYLYNYAGMPWKTQKRVRTLLDQWFRNDVMGVPGDEDGGGMSAFVVFSQMGFYPVTPGSPTYNIGSPVFENVKVDLGDGHVFEIKARNASPANKYIQSARLNGAELNQPWFTHADIAQGGTLELEMGPRPNRQWGTATPPPSAARLPE